jgi:3-deoxy-7-phosphoheptulonate synthase
LAAEASPTGRGVRTIGRARAAVRAVLSGEDRRLLVVVGPCSVHDPDAALEYARRLRDATPEFDDALVLVMRAYVEKPRTTVGWKGLVYDPRLDGSCRIDEGLVAARRLLCALADLGQPAAIEFLSPLVAPYLADLVAWGAVGARTSESQIHRELASALPVPVGFKNGTDGDVRTAASAVAAARRGHAFLWAEPREGRVAECRSAGNPDAHIILRGSPGAPNYRAADVREASTALAHVLGGASSVPPTAAIVIDCSHDNCGKDHRRQAAVAADVAAQVRSGCTAVRGVMIESFLCEGRQDLPPPPPVQGADEGGSALSRLSRGVSITDACIGWEQTRDLLRLLADAVRAGRPPGQ